MTTGPELGSTESDAVACFREAAEQHARTRFDEAVALYWRGIALMPEHVTAWSGLAAALEAQGRPLEGLQCRRRAAALAPTDPEVRSALAARLRHLGDFGEALAVYRRLVAIWPEAEFRLAAAECLLSLDRAAEALAEADAVAAEDPAHAGLATVQAAVFRALTRSGPSKRSRPRGHVDAFTPTRIAGWVWDAKAPAVRQEVTIRVNYRIAATGMANRQRRDLAAAGIGDGAHGFDVQLDPPLRPDDHILCRIEVMNFQLTLRRPPP